MEFDKDNIEHCMKVCRACDQAVRDGAVSCRPAMEGFQFSTELLEFAREQFERSKVDLLADQHDQATDYDLSDDRR